MSQPYFNNNYPAQPPLAAKPKSRRLLYVILALVLIFGCLCPASVVGTLLVLGPQIGAVSKAVYCQLGTPTPAPQQVAGAPTPIDCSTYTAK